MPYNGPVETLDLREVPPEFLVALDRADLLGQAKGILMALHNIRAGEAFEMLVRAARAAGMPVHDLAMDLVERRETALRLLDDASEADGSSR